MLAHYEYLGELTVHGRPIEGFSKANLDGNGCVELINAWDDILRECFGDFSDSAEEEIAEEERAHATAVRQEQLQSNAALSAAAEAARTKARNEPDATAREELQAQARELDAQLVVPQAVVTTADGPALHVVEPAAASVNWGQVSIPPRPPHFENSSCRGTRSCILLTRPLFTGQAWHRESEGEEGESEACEACEAKPCEEGEGESEAYEEGGGKGEACRFRPPSDGEACRPLDNGAKAHDPRKPGDGGGGGRLAVRSRKTEEGGPHRSPRRALREAEEARPPQQHRAPQQEEVCLPRPAACSCCRRSDS